MQLIEKLQDENEQLRERLFRMERAFHCINESLDFKMVLQEVADGARSLTGA